MADTTPAEPEYIVEYVDGPLAGTDDRRILVEGVEPRIAVVAAVQGLESTFWYVAGAEREVEGELHVQYSFDAAASDPVTPVRDTE